MHEDFFSDGNRNAAIDVPAFFDSRVTNGISQLVALGFLISVGTTRDGGAISIGITDDGRRRREYFRTSEDASDWLRMAVDALSGVVIGSPGPDPTGIQKPTRRARRAV
jgi:hypothetical protein